MYYPATQLDGAFQSVLVRSTRPVASLRAEIIAAVHAVDAGLPVADIRSYDDLLAQAIADRRLTMSLLGAFAVIALILAGMGIYSVIGYGVAQRTNEFGIRFALGAEPAAVVRMVMKEGLMLALVGLVIGLGISYAVTRLLQQLLFEVSATDPRILGIVAVFLTLVAALACFLPARRAMKVDPMTALRAE
jgi:putative ABC transport system permease protein